jgi:hypothetical protein
MVATFPSCSRTKVIPESASAGANVSVESSPENNPGPVIDASWEIVFCLMLNVRLMARNSAHSSIDPCPATIYRPADKGKMSVCLASPALWL